MGRVRFSSEHAQHRARRCNDQRRHRREENLLKALVGVITFRESFSSASDDI
jgi:hypothetical protein